MKAAEVLKHAIHVATSEGYRVAVVKKAADPAATRISCGGERYEPGTRIRHLQSGREGRVAEVLGHNAETGVYGYMVVWDDTPGQKTFTTSERVKQA